MRSAFGSAPFVVKMRAVSVKSARSLGTSTS